MKKNYIVLLLFIITSYFNFSEAQVIETDKGMLWASVGISHKFNDRFSASYLQINSISLKEPRFNFIQSNFNFNIHIHKKWTISLGTSPTFSLDTIANNQLIHHRISLGIKFKTKLGKRIRMINSLHFQHYFTTRAKFQQRYFYRLDFYYRDSKLPWKLRPFISQRLYVYTNGRLLQYYDSNNNKAALLSPDGLHAYRLQLGVKFYPVEEFSFSIYYLKQVEFNTAVLGSRDINNLNPNSQKIRRPFYDFSVIGISLNYKILNKKQRKKARKNKKRRAKKRKNKEHEKN